MPTKNTVFKVSSTKNPATRVNSSKITATKVISTKTPATSDSANNPEIDESDHSKKFEESKVKLFLSRNIDGLEKSFVPNKELSTKLVYMMDQSKQFEDGFNTENESTEEISIEDDDRTTNKSCQWKSVVVTKKHQEVFENELPEGFNYIVKRFKMNDESDIPHESKFEANFLVGICKEGEVSRFVHELEMKTGTNFNVARSDRVGKKNWKQRFLKCSRNVNTTTSPELAKNRGKGAGQGRVKGTERQAGKDKQCKTTMSTTLKPCDLSHKDSQQCFKLAVNIVVDHTHAVESTNSWNFLKVEEPARLRLLELFEEGLTPSRAKRVFEDELMAKYGDQWLEISSKRSINPDTNYVFNLHSAYWRDKFGTINGPDSYQKAFEFIEKYNKSTETKVASIRQLPNGAVVVVVVDELSKRVHSTVPQSGQIVFIDGTGSLDRLNHHVIKLMTESPVGGLPLGYMILSDQTEKTIDAGFEDLKKLLPKKAFYDRGPERGPELIMTDDDPVSIMITNC